jgi:hypothetical protein
LEKRLSLAEKVKYFVGNTQEKGKRRKIKKIAKSKKASSKQLIFYA